MSAAMMAARTPSPIKTRIVSLLMCPVPTVNNPRPPGLCRPIVENICAATPQFGSNRRVQARQGLNPHAGLLRGDRGRFGLMQAIAAAALEPALQTVEIEIDHRRRVEGEQLAQR